MLLGTHAGKKIKESSNDLKGDVKVMREKTAANIGLQDQ